MSLSSLLLFFFNDTATTEIYTLSLHDALPIYFDLSFLPSRSPGRLVEKEPIARSTARRSEEHTSELQSHLNLVCRLLLEKKKPKRDAKTTRATTCPEFRQQPPTNTTQSPSRWH